GSLEDAGDWVVDASGETGATWGASSTVSAAISSAIDGKRASFSFSIARPTTALTCRGTSGRTSPRGRGCDDQSFETSSTGSRSRLDGGTPEKSSYATTPHAN